MALLSASLIHALIILNPAAGHGAGAKAEAAVTRAFRLQGWAVDVVRTERPMHGADLAARAVRAGVDRIVAVGGDGTVHEVATGLLGEKGGAEVALGVVPIGSGNDFAKLIGVYRHSPVRAVARLVGAEPRRFDVGRVLDEYFVNSMGCGFDAEVVRARNAMPNLPGVLSYLVPALRSFASYRPQLLEVRSAEFRETGYMMLVEVCNGTTAGGSYRFAPGADPTDGRLDVCLVRRVSLPRFLVALPRVMRGTHGKMKEVALFQTKELVIRSPERSLLLHLDGELRTPEVRECTIRVEPRRLKVLVVR